MQIKLKNENRFDYSKLNEHYVQNMLRKAYDKENNKRAYCCCSDKELELVISYLREHDSFYLKRMPYQSPIDHANGCDFRHHKPSRLYKGDNGLTLAIPAPNETPVTDHNHAANLLGVIWDELEKNYLKQDKHSSWAKIAQLIPLIAESIEVNHIPLNELLMTKKPQIFENQPRLALPKGRIVISELHSVKETSTNRFIIKAKGFLNTIWLNNFRVDHLNNHTKDLLLGDQNSGFRYIILMTMIDGMKSNNTDLHCSSIAVIKVDSDSFVRS